MTSLAEAGRAESLILRPVHAVGVVELVVRRLGEAIGTGVFSAGERLPSERDLAVLLGVSTVTLRQALQVLRSAGYLETRRGRGGGTFVCGDIDGVLRSFSGDTPLLTVDEIREFTDWRRAVSGEAAFLAAERATAADVARLQELSAAVGSALSDFPSFRMADARLHVGIAEASGSSGLLSAETSIQSRLSDVLQAIPGPTEADAASHQEHQMLLRALESRDARLARDVMLRHVEGTFNWYVGLLLGRLGETAPATREK